jgi:hypothetical protein
MFCSFPFKPFFLCDLRDPGIFFVGWQSSQQRMFLLERASQLVSPLLGWFARLSPKPLSESFAGLGQPVVSSPIYLRSVMISGSFPAR